MPRCYICNALGNARQMPRIGQNDERRQLSIDRRNARDQPNIMIDDNTRLCFNCNLSVDEEINLIQNNPHPLRLNVLNQVGNHVCIVCHVAENIHRISDQCRVHIFIHGNKYAPKNIRSCDVHLDNNGMMLKVLIPGLLSTNKACLLSGQEQQLFFNGLRSAALIKTHLDDIDYLSDEEFQCLFPVTKGQFANLYEFCERVPDGNTYRYVSKKDLMVFLCKMRQGLSDEFLKVLFCYSSRQAVSMAVYLVRNSLLIRFVPDNLGVHAITRDEFIDNHVTPFANELYNDEPDQRKAILLIDSTSTDIHKSSNFQILRQSFSLHKKKHLLKPTTVMGTDGYFLDVFGPYFSDFYNNDAAILQDKLNDDQNDLRNWIQNGDIFIVDRGYRDATGLLEAFGIDHKMPAMRDPGERQLTTEQANQTRIVTKNRWVVEARNAHLKNIFKFLNHTFNIQNARYINEYFRIGAAIINRYYPVLNMEGATIELARQMRVRAQEPNVMQARVQLENWLRLRNVWVRLHNQFPDFPHLDIEYLKDLTYGIYQINLSPAYIQDKLRRDDDAELQIDQHFDEPNIVSARIYSRFRNRVVHRCFISYTPEHELNEENHPITSYYCQCQSGARTLGTCTHIASIVWYLGWARHQPAVRYPNQDLLNTSDDAAHRNNP